MPSFRDPDSFHLVAPPPFLSPQSCPCPFYLPHVTVDGVREGRVEGHTESQGPDLNVANITFPLFPSARTFHWPTPL